MAEKISIVLGTKNRHKIGEILAIRRLHQGAKIPVRFIPLSEFPLSPDVKETGKTYLANARKKALAWAKATKHLTLAEDSGLEVKALNWAPGVYSARYASAGQKNASYRSNNQKLLDQLKHISISKRIARYRCCAVLAGPGGIIAIAQGVCYGRIAPAEKGKNGFGYDPLFIPNKEKKTFAQLPAKLKHTISHRARALKLIFRKLPKIVDRLKNGTNI